jgi:drug/metabolite transporter superfamily protein YnfA
MNRNLAILVLVLAALLEASGDAIMRAGLHATGILTRVALFLVAALVLSAYGCTVNAPPWDFGKLLGLYVVFFFIAAQLISWFAFRQAPSLTVMVGGLFIIAGGIVISLNPS